MPRLAELLPHAKDHVGGLSLEDEPDRPLSFREALKRGYFPHHVSWLLDNPVRRLLISPEALARRLPIAADSHILEIGPGSGYFSRTLARMVPGGRLELLDLQPEMLDKARARFGTPLPANVGFTAADACGDLPYEDGSFDLVLLVTALGELPDRERALRSFRRLLAPGGHLAVHEHWPDPDRIGPDELVRLVEPIGFRLVRVVGPRWNYTSLFQCADAAKTKAQAV